jgi:phosphate starvation-inducible protein PhoH
LPDSRRSGLLEAIEILGKVNEISFTYFDEHDVVRHSLVQRIIKAYDEHNAAHPHHGRGTGFGASRDKQLPPRE